MVQKCLLFFKTLFQLIQVNNFSDTRGSSEFIYIFIQGTNRELPGNVGGTPCK